MSQMLSGGEGAAVAIALGEALFWTAALDDYSKRLRGKTTYFREREADEHGRTVGGLVFARNLLGHGLNTASAISFEVHSPTLIRDGDKVTLRWPRLPGKDYGAPDRGTAFSVKFSWAPLQDLPAPGGPQHRRDDWYGELIAGKPLSKPLDVAAAWFEARGAGSGSE